MSFNESAIEMKDEKKKVKGGKSERIRETEGILVCLDDEISL